MLTETVDHKEITMGRIINRLPVVMAEQGVRFISDLARMTGLSYPVVHRYVTGDIQRLDLGVLSKICEALHSDVGDLFRHIPDGDGDR